MNRTAHTLDLLRRYQSRNVLYIDPDGGWPIVWERARGVHVWDVAGRKYLDLTAAFGVAAAGHANPHVVRAGRRQMAILLHAMGDVHPHARKAELAARLSQLTFERWQSQTKPRRRTRLVTRHQDTARGKSIFCNSGFEAVEAALKTALLATGKPGVIAFHGAYHGLGYGALNATHRQDFRSPFQTQLGRFGHFVPYPDENSSLDHIAEMLRRTIRRGDIGAILVEPVQGRGGIRVAPMEFLPLLRSVCDEAGLLLIADEIYTGFGRTGRWFACEHSETIPDLICLGKALTGGFPLSACVGRADLMDAAWPESRGEALHTSTFLGHPVGCAMALAQIGEIERGHLVDRSAQAGEILAQQLNSLQGARPDLELKVQGLGLMAGIRCARRRPTRRQKVRHAAAISEDLSVMPLVRAMLKHGFILLPAGAQGEVLAFTPPLIISERQLTDAIDRLAVLLSRNYSVGKL